MSLTRIKLSCIILGGIVTAQSEDEHSASEFKVNDHLIKYFFGQLEFFLTKLCKCHFN